MMQNERDNRMKRLMIVLAVAGFLVVGCANLRGDIMDPENFKYFEGTLVNFEYKILIMHSYNGQRMLFRVGRNTIFTPIFAHPRKSWQMEDFLHTGDRLKIRYFDQLIRSSVPGDYFVAFEVTKMAKEEQ